ncbi:MAG: hypothetical protein AAGA42_00990 [Actinomycetota bacterium]
MSEGMAGHGDYDVHSDHQARDAEAQHAQVAALAQAITIGDQVVIADYGCGQGRVSTPLVEAAIVAVRERDRDVPVFVVHNDVIENDWATLFAHLGGSGTYLDTSGGPITPTASAVSFYEPVAPSGVVDLGMSVAAAQWLSQPGFEGSTAALYFDQLVGDERTAMEAQADRDWVRFLSARSVELAPGGRLLVGLMAVGPSEVAAGHDAWRLFSTVLDEMAAEGHLSATRLAEFTFPVYERTITELRRPFDDGDVDDLLVLDDITLAASTSPAIEAYRNGVGAAAAADAFVGFFRAFSEPTVRAGLGVDDATLDVAYRRLTDVLASSMETFDFTVNVATLTVRRR